MAAHIDSMLYTGELPWHGLGNEVNGDALYSWEECLRQAGLDWEVNTEKLTTPDGIEVPDYFATTRIKEGEKSVLGVVGSNYKVLQNRDAMRWFQPFLDSHQVRIETAGALHGGAVVWVLAKLCNEIQIGRNDLVGQHILLSHSHNGRYSVEARLTPIRVVCHNTLTMAKATRQGVFGKVKHTQSMEWRLDQVRSTLAEANHLFLLEAEKYQFLASKRIDSAQADTFFRKCLGIDTAKPTEEMHGKTLNTLNQVKTLFFTGRGAELETASGTWWGAYNAVEEYKSWYKGRSNEARMESVFFGEDKVNPLELALSMAS